MKEVIKQLILDFHTAAIPVPSQREFQLPALPENIRKAFVFMGMRRSGKTWAMYQIMHKLLNQGFENRALLYINFEDDRLMGLKAADLQQILEA